MCPNTVFLVLASAFFLFQAWHSAIRWPLSRQYKQGHLSLPPEVSLFPLLFDIYGDTRDKSRIVFLLASGIFDDRPDGKTLRCIKTNLSANTAASDNEVTFLSFKWTTTPLGRQVLISSSKIDSCNSSKVVVLLERHHFSNINLFSLTNSTRVCLSDFTCVQNFWWYASETSLWIN